MDSQMKFKQTPLYLAISVALSGCFESNSSGVSTGVFVDDVVEGIEYQTATQSGFTNAKGEFKYLDGETITFKVGGTTFGSAAGKAMVTPIELDSSANTSNITAKVTNMAQLLQTLDEDLDPNNGIQISATTRTALKDKSISLSASNFDTELEIQLPADKKPSYLLTEKKVEITSAIAKEHMQTTLAKYNKATTETVTHVPAVSEVTRYAIDTTAVDLEYKGSFVNSFASQNSKLKLGIGSGLGLLEQTANSIKLVAISDRGPNLDAPEKGITGNTDGYTYTASKIFPLPTYTPRFATLTVTDSGATIDANSVTLLKSQSGDLISGRPLLPGTTGATGEVAIAENLKQLTGDANGLDPEGIVKDAQGNYWICDEYGPFMLKLDSTGKELARYEPGKASGVATGLGLPSIVKQRRPNRGMEGVALSPEGMVYGLVQSPLYTTEKGKTSQYKKGAFLRLVELDPTTGATKIFAVPTKAKTATSVGVAPKDVKAGDLVALGNGKFLMIEQGKDLTGKLFNDVTLIDITNATDLTNKDAAYVANMTTPTEKSIEELVNYDPKSSDAASAIDTKAAARDALFTSNGIMPVSKTKLFDLRDLGWMAEKAEGLTVLSDKQTLFVINDNDFGVSFKLVGGCSAKESDITAYGVDVATGELSLSDNTCTAKETQAHMVLNKPEERQTRLWKIKLANAI
jgi:hypothetical protein